MTSASEQLTNLISQETSTAVSDDVKKLSAAIRQRGNPSCILFYGSGLWKKPDNDTIYDFYVLVDQLRDFEKRKFSKFLGAIIPPNVYYMEVKDGDKVLRCKYALIRTDHFIKSAVGKTFTPQIWARFAQPARIIYSCDGTTTVKINNCLAQSVIHFHRITLPLTPSNANSREIWLRGLKETYKAELRSERLERTQTLFNANAESFIRRSELVTPLLQNIKRGSKYASILSQIKRPFQKTIAFIRLMKATATFEGSVDYALYKIERQSGIRLEATDFQRRYPLIAAWPLLWKFWRLGAFSQK